MSTTQPIRNYADVQKLKEYYLEKEAYRDYLLVCVCLNTALRINDVLDLRWQDLVLRNGKKIRTHIKIKETKTGKNTVIKINTVIRKAIRLYIKRLGIHSEFVFTNNKGGKLSRVSAYNIIKEGGKAIGLDYEISCHSLRKTFGYHAWKMGTPPAVLMEIYNHSSYTITKRYLGIIQEDKDKVYGTVVL
jgi:integrase